MKLIANVIFCNYIGRYFYSFKQQIHIILKYYTNIKCPINYYKLLSQKEYLHFNCVGIYISTTMLSSICEKRFFVGIEDNNTKNVK